MVTKRSKRRNVRAKPPKRAVPRTRKRRGRPMGLVDPLVSCVFGPVDHPGEMLGVPDGESTPSVVLEHRQTVVLTPRANSNDISFALVSSPYGAVSIGDAMYTGAMNTVDWDTDTSFGELQWPKQIWPPQTRTINCDYSTVQSHNQDVNTGMTTAITAWYQTVPFSETLMPATVDVDRVAELGLQATKFRVLTTSAVVNFTGSSLENSGVASTARVVTPYNDDKSIPFGTDDIPANYKSDGAGNGPSNRNYADDPFSYGQPFAHYGVDLLAKPPTSFGDVAALPGSRTFPARESVNLINPPTSFEYQDMRKLWVPYYVVNSGRYQNVVPGAEGWQPNYAFCYAGMAVQKDNPPLELEKRFIPIPGLGAAPISYYYASGLGANASITVTVRTCVEYQLSFRAPSARFARMPPPERPLAIKQVTAIAKTLPSSIPATPVTEKSGWLGNALSWYGNTMKNIIGESWRIGLGIGAQAARTMLPQMNDIAGLIGGTSRLAIKGR